MRYIANNRQHPDPTGGGADQRANDADDFVPSSSCQPPSATEIKEANRLIRQQDEELSHLLGIDPPREEK